ncbi:MAG: glycosyl hydrolase 115 family protein [Bacteroidota bacterium]
MRKPMRLIIISAILTLLPLATFAQSPGHQNIVEDHPRPGYFALSAQGKTAALLMADGDWPGVKRAGNSFIEDIQKVTGNKPLLIGTPKGRQLVIAGTIGRSVYIDRLIKAGKLDVRGIAGHWETYVIQVIKKPFPGVDEALVIGGSDKRGTIFGLYDLSAQIGVSPWYWWADVAIKKKKELFVAPARHTDGTPAVKYRGIFINDEAPAFSGWSREKFGGPNHQVYEKIFELILRLKGNYLWPAMWGNAFNDDDKANPILADEYGVVMGTSHHEPMDRAQQEWKRYGKGEWNYETNQTALHDFWKQGIANMGNKETVVTIGMRGDGDKPMTEGSNITLLENIVKDQRQIIQDVLKKDPSEVPQIWALYKEVQDYYDKGMRVPDDVTLLLCDDNWGNLRKLPSLTEKPRKGGYGIYYHFDYVGGPRNYKWLNTNTIAKTWEQMHLAYEYQARQLWVVNVGDLKPMEYPISFFLDYAWAPDRWPASSLRQYAVDWATQQFGTKHAAEIARLLSLYTRYNARRKPELLDQNTYSLTNYKEFESVTADYQQLKVEAEELSRRLTASDKDAFYELVLHPIVACANLNEMYLEAAKNKYFAQQGDAGAANLAAENVKRLFDNDQQITDFYNTRVAGGKWNHMMDQTHIGYTSWQEPRTNRMPTVQTIIYDSLRSSHPATGTAGSTSSFSSSNVPEVADYISIDAEKYSRAIADKENNWLVIPDLGNTLSGVTISKVTASRIKPGPGTPHLEYDITLKDSGMVSVTCFITPTLDFRNGDGLFYAISIDDESPQLINIAPKVDSREWSMAVSNNIRKLASKHHVGTAGRHTVKFWLVDPAVVIEKLVVDQGGLKPSFLGPPVNSSKQP